MKSYNSSRNQKFVHGQFRKQYADNLSCISCLSVSQKAKRRDKKLAEFAVIETENMIHLTFGPLTTYCKDVRNKTENRYLWWIFQSNQPFLTPRLIHDQVMKVPVALCICYLLSLQCYKLWKWCKHGIKRVGWRSNHFFSVTIYRKLNFEASPTA